MAIEQNPELPRKFLPCVLPWLAVAVALLVYLTTLNHWISLASLDVLDLISGPVWQPTLTQPLNWTVLKLFSGVPEAALPLVLNIFAAVCAAAILGLLARTVVLLPQSSAEAHRSRSRSSTSNYVPFGWIPPVLAVAACGLQLTFWEHATSVSAEIIDLLIFAYLVRCLFEFKADGEERWLYRSAVLYGIGMANNWGMIGFFPAYLTAIIFLKRMNFYRGLFLIRMGLCGLAGLSFYFLLPLVHSFSHATPVPFWTALAANYRYQSEILLDFPEGVAFILVLTFLAPIFVISICQRAETKEEGGDNPVATFVRRVALRGAHILFMGLAVWLALDLPFSPRRIGFGQPLLSYYYLNALVLGWCAGYLLRTGLGRFHGELVLTILAKLVAKIGAYWVCLMLVGLPLELVWRNFTELRLTNGPAVRRFAEQIYQGLPPGKSVVLSDSPEHLILLQAALAAHGHDKDALLVDLAALPLKQYQAVMSQRCGARWPAPPNSAAGPVLDRASVTDVVAKFAAREKVVCLNPGFGYYQEPFAERPSGLVHLLLERPLTDLASQHMDAATADANERFWQEQWDGGLRALAAQVKPIHPADTRFTENLLARAFLAREQNLTAGSLRNAYARALDDWAVQLQRLGRWREAGVWFQRVLLLKPENLAARINQVYNAQHQRGDATRLDLHEMEGEFRDQFGKYATWGRVIMDSGPVDEPTFLNETARVLLFENNNRQAAVDYARCAELAPDWAESQIWFSQSLVAIHDFDLALKVMQRIQPAVESMNGMRLSQFLFCHTLALQGLGRTNEADDFVMQFSRRHDDQNDVLATAVELCVRVKHFEAALSFLNQLLSREPNNPRWLSNKAFAEMGLLHREDAIAAITSAIQLAPTNQILRLNRAIVSLDAGELDAARGDYLELLKAAPKSRQALFGLAEIAWRKSDTEPAIAYCRQYLANADPRSFEYNLVSNRLHTLEQRLKPIPP